jgi:flagellar FliL protein
MTASVNRTVAAAGTDKDKDSEKPAKSKKKLIIIVVAVLALAGGGAFFFLSGGEKGPVKPDPGVVVKLDPINVNLAGGHYLKVGMALQATKAAGEEVDGAKALDIAISTLSNRTLAELSSNANREKVKEELKKKIEKAYEEEVMDIYFTEFVMQ